MHIALLVGTWGNIGGIERHAATLASAWQGEQPVHLAIPATDNSRGLLEWLRAQGAQAEATPALLPSDQRHTWESTMRLRRQLRRWQPEVVSFHYREKIPLSDILAARLAGVKTCVVSLHCVPYPTRLRRQITRATAGLVDAFIVHSKPVAAALREMGIPTTKIIHLPYGLQMPDHIAPVQEARAQLRIPLDAFVIGTHGRLQPEKGIENVIEATAALPPGQPPLLLVAGTGPERARLQALAQQRQVETRWLGQLNGPALTTFYAALDVFTLAPTWEEAFGLVFIEAAQCGVPSISWRVGGIEEAVVHQQTGLLARARDVSDLARMINLVRGDPVLRATLGHAAGSRARERFSDQRLGRDFLHTLTSLPRRPDAARLSYPDP